MFNGFKEIAIECCVDTMCDTKMINNSRIQKNDPYTVILLGYDGSHLLYFIICNYKEKCNKEMEVVTAETRKDFANQ